MPPSCIVGTGSEVVWPSYSNEVDYELELTIVIGKECSMVDGKTGAECIAGYMIANDISGRSVTFKKGRKERPWDDFYDWLCGKWAEGFLPMGPYLVTAGEVGDAHALDMHLTVNGQTRQKANTSQMIYSVGDVVSFMSHIMTLQPGDVIATGTPEGVGKATGNYLQPGDKVECSIEKLGTLNFTLGQRPKTFYEPIAK
jgi:2-keto-4-pentenoate hydratase/2-oxohepta-3-ene-1,7-dioic acid hydratase in catechol pathway